MNLAAGKETAASVSLTTGAAESFRHASSLTMWKELMTGRLSALFRSTAQKHEPLPTQEQMMLIVGLGNPGREYADSRHNLGFKCINVLAKNHDIDTGSCWFKKRS